MEKRVRILSTTDTHGYCLQSLGEQYDYHKEMDLLIDAGDFFIGNSLTTYFNTEFEISPLVAQANQLGYDVMIPGNHDFDYGVSFLQKQVAQLEATYLCANITGLDDKLLFEPYTIIEKNNVKIGVIGLMTSLLPVISSYKITKEFKCLNAIECLERLLPTVKEQSDIVVVAYHGGIERDLATGKPTQYDTGEDEAYKITEHFPEIDGLICGHQHRVNCGKIGSTLIVQPGFKSSHLGVFDYRLKDKKILQTKASLIELMNQEENPLEKIKGYEEWLLKEMDFTFFNEYIANIAPNAFSLIEKKGRKIVDFLESFKAPYMLSLYQLSQEEMRLLLKEHDIHDIILENEQLTPLQDSYLIITNTNYLPSYRLKKNYINNVFDEYFANRKKVIV